MNQLILDKLAEVGIPKDQVTKCSVFEHPVAGHEVTEFVYKDGNKQKLVWLRGDIRKLGQEHLEDPPTTIDNAKFTVSKVPNPFIHVDFKDELDHAEDRARKAVQAQYDTYWKIT